MATTVCLRLALDVARELSNPISPMWTKLVADKAISRLCFLVKIILFYVTNKYAGGGPESSTRNHMLSAGFWIEMFNVLRGMCQVCMPASIPLLLRCLAERAGEQWHTQKPRRKLLSSCSIKFSVKYIFIYKSRRYSVLFCQRFTLFAFQEQQLESSVLMTLTELNCVSCD